MRLLVKKNALKNYMFLQQFVLSLPTASSEGPFLTARPRADRQAHSPLYFYIFLFIFRQPPSQECKHYESRELPCLFQHRISKSYNATWHLLGAQ